MPQRTYNGIDLINYFTNVQHNFDPIPATPSTPSQGVALLFVSYTWSGGPDSISCTSYIDIFGELDYSVFPAIPAGALINEIDFSWSINSVQAAASDNGPAPGNQSSAAASALFTANLGGFPFTASGQSVQDAQSAYGPVNASVNINDNFNNHSIITFNPPITKAELQTAYFQLQLHIGFDGSGISAYADGIDTVSASITGTVSVSNFNLVITYENGPISSGITITPGSGNVEPGQILVVTTDPTNPNAPDLEELDYAAITSDGKVIPIIPQFIYDPETGEIIQVWLEAPYPAADPCFDCFPGCPECTAAFASCEDLSSDECAEAMQECLDCLVNCLEDLQLAEECQQSSGNPPESPVLVIIIASGGTQFSGNVTLGSFVILVANGSGLYRFTTGLAHDTLYTADRDGTTYNVKIPNPGARTGFFRS